MWRFTHRRILSPIANEIITFVQSMTFHKMASLLFSFPTILQLMEISDTLETVYCKVWFKCDAIALVHFVRKRKAVF